MEVLRILVHRHMDHVRENGGAITEEEALGLLVSAYLKWNGVRILRVAAAAPEDANFHGECDLVRRMVKNIEMGMETNGGNTK